MVSPTSLDFANKSKVHETFYEIASVTLKLSFFLPLELAYTVYDDTVVYHHAGNLPLAIAFLFFLHIFLLPNDLGLTDSTFSVQLPNFPILTKKNDTDRYGHVTI